MGNSSFAVRFKLLGVPVAVHPAFFVVLFLFGFIGSSQYIWIWVAIGFVSILIHEFGHALTARAFGSPVHVELIQSGGVTYHNQMSDGRSLLVTLAGPATGIAIGLPLWLLVDETDYSGAVHAALVYAVFISLGWSLLNLLPILPLDGGNALASILALTTGQDRVGLTRRISVGVAGLLAVFAATRGYIFGAIYAAMFIGMNAGALRQENEGPLRNELSVAHSLLPSRPAESARIADEVIAKKPSAQLLTAAVNTKLWALLFQRDVAAAQALLARHPGIEVPPATRGSVLLLAGDRERGLAFITEAMDHDKTLELPIIDIVIETGALDDLTQRLRHLEFEPGQMWAPTFQALLHYGARYAASARVGALILDDENPRTGFTAYNVACSYNRLGRHDVAMQWLARAVDDGFDSIELLDGDEDIAALRAQPGFAELRARIAAKSAAS
jgi:Zn-dependent protease